MASSSSSMVRLLLFLTISATLMQQTLGATCYSCKHPNGRGAEGRSSDATNSISDVFGEGGPNPRQGSNKPICPDGKENWPTSSCDGKCITLHDSEDIVRDCVTYEQLERIHLNGVEKCLDRGSVKGCKCDGDLCNGCPKPECESGTGGGDGGETGGDVQLKYATVKCYNCGEERGRRRRREATTGAESFQSFLDGFGKGGQKGRQGQVKSECRGRKRSWDTEKCYGKCSITFIKSHNQINRECVGREGIESIKGRLDGKGCYDNYAQKGCVCDGNLCNGCREPGENCGNGENDRDYNGRDRGGNGGAGFRSKSSLSLGANGVGFFLGVVVMVM